MSATSSPTPAHVPAHLVFDVDVGSVAEEGFMTDPFKLWAHLKDVPPVFWSNRKVDGTRLTGSWVVTSADAIRAIMQDTEHFSHERGRFNMSEDSGSAAMNSLIPLFLDPPEHGKYRALLAPVFSPKSIDAVEQSLRGLSAELIDGFADTGECEFMSAYARPFPVIVFMRMMGLPLEGRDQFIEWEHQLTQGETVEQRTAASVAVGQTLYGLIQQRRASPQDDIVSRLVAAEVDGAPLTPDKLMGICMLLYLAGLDTVAAGLGHTVRYLAEHPEVQARLRAHPDLIPDAVEESLRYHTWLPTGRMCVKDIDFMAAPFRAGDWVQAILWGASNDPRENERPREFLVPREPNRHFAFGAGVHRCAGSHLARREMRIGIRMLLERLGEFRIKPGARLRYDGGMVCLGDLPLEWDMQHSGLRGTA